MGNTLKTIFRYAAVIIGFISFISISTNTAARDVLGIAGYSGNTDDTHYGYAGFIIPLKIGENQEGNFGQDGFLLRLWGAGLAYDYDTGTPSVNIDVTGGIGEAGLGYHWVRPTYTNSLYISYVGKFLDDDPDDPFNNNIDDHNGLKFQADTTQNINEQFGINLNGSYTAFLDDYWVRGRLFYRYTDSIKIGPELTGLGGDRYDRIKFGAFISGIKIGSTSMVLNVGADHDNRDDDTDMYFGVSFSRMF